MSTRNRAPSDAVRSRDDVRDRSEKSQSAWRIEPRREVRFSTDRLGPVPYEGPRGIPRDAGLDDRYQWSGKEATR